MTSSDRAKIGDYCTEKRHPYGLHPGYLTLHHYTSAYILSYIYCTYKINVIY